jgi:hypothetical protein
MSARNAPDNANGEYSTEVFDQLVRDSIIRRIDKLQGEELLNTLGFLIQRDRRKSAEEPPAGLYPIA